MSPFPHYLGIFDDSQNAFLDRLEVKLEPMVQIAPITPLPVLLGFEVLGTDRELTPFFRLEGTAAALGIAPDVLRIALLVKSLERVDQAARRLRPLVNVDGLCFSLNFDHELLASNLLRPILEAYLRAEHQRTCIFEVNEHCRDEDVGTLRTLVADYHLKLAIDDGNKMAPLVRAFLADLVVFSKLDASATLPLMRAHGQAPDAVMAEITRHRVNGRPYVVEGIEDETWPRFLADRWQGGALWGQGYAMLAGEPFTRILRHVGKNAYFLKA